MICLYAYDIIGLSKDLKNMETKNKRHLTLLGASLLGALLIGFIAYPFDKEKKQDNDKKDTPLEEKLNIYYTSDDRIIYTYGIDSIKYEGIEIKYSEDVFETMDTYRNTLREVTTANDGGSKIYEDAEQDVHILFCNTIEGNKDIYIGKKGMVKENGFCTADSREFIQTFHILHVEDSNDEKYLYITIKRYNGEDVKTFKIDRSLAPKIEAGETYEFTFKRTNVSIDDSMDSIFNGTILTKLEKTDTNGLDERNDVIE